MGEFMLANPLVCIFLELDDLAVAHRRGKRSQTKLAAFVSSSLR
jgi:hypothetical protein